MMIISYLFYILFVLSYLFVENLFDNNNIVLDIVSLLYEPALHSFMS